jgi:hypothetical protein
MAKKKKKKNVKKLLTDLRIERKDRKRRAKLRG